jgi:phytoene desaturase
MQKKAAIIGSGIAGLASAIRLANKGIETHVFEANLFPGGKINSRSVDGYRFDQGPSLLTSPEYLEDLYRLCGKDFSAFEMAELDLSFKYFFTDGTQLELGSTRSQVVAEIVDKLGENPDSVNNYLTKAEKNYLLISPLFIEKSLHRWTGLFGKKLVKALAHLPSYKLFSTMNDENSKAFKNERTVQIFNRFAQYNGSHPFKAPAMLNMISHLEINTPPFLPKNGMIQITDALVELAKEQGVHFHFGEKVEKIIVRDKAIKGIKTAQQQFDCEFVVSNMDISFTYERLLKEEYQPTKILNQEKSSSVLAFHWGIKKSFETLHVHNMIFSDNDKGEFDEAFESKTISKDPSFYLYISSKAIPNDAPAGCENWFILINAPIENGQDWDNEIKEKRAFVIEKMSNLLGEDVTSLIATEITLDPRDIEERYSGKQGSIYGNASNNRFSAFYRHPNYSKRISGLYFAGVSVHPGGGIPLALNSANIACKCLFDDHKMN